MEINVDGTGRLILVSVDTGTKYVEVTGGSAKSVDLSSAQVNAVSALSGSVVGTYTSDEIYELLANSIVAINNAKIRCCRWWYKGSRNYRCVRVGHQCFDRDCSGSGCSSG